MKLLLTLSIRYLGGRKLRTFLTTLAIVFGVLVIFGMNTLIPAFLQSFTSNAMAAAGQVDATITNVTGEAFPQEVLEKLRGVEGITAIAGTLERPVNLPADYFDKESSIPDSVAAVTLVGADPETIRSLYSYQVLEGRFLNNSDVNSTVITESLAEAANLKLGEVLSLPTSTGIVDLTVIGILPQRLLPGNEEVLVNLTAAQAWLNMPDKINVIDANFNSTEEARRLEIENNMKAILGTQYTIGVLQPGAELLNNIKLGQMIISLFGGLGLLMGGFIIFNTFRTVIAERRHDIGMLRAVGASRKTISWLILTEGLIQGVIGTAAGLIFGYLFGLLVLKIVAPMMQSFLNVEVGSPNVTPGLIIISVVMGVGITVLAGLLPARAASHITPLEALRPTVGKVAFRQLAGARFWIGMVMIAIAVAALFTKNTNLIGLGALLITVGLILVSPSLVNPIARLFGGLAALIFAKNGTGQLAEGNLSRQPGRAAITAATTMIALAILVMAGSLLSSVSISFLTMLKNSLSSDFLMVPPSVAVWSTNVGASPELADQLRQVDGVEVVSTVRFAGTKVGDAAVGLLGVNPVAYTKTAGLTFVKGDPEQAYSALESGRSMIINGPFSATTGVKMGDEIKLLTLAGEQTYTVVGIASDYLNAKTTTGYISQANIEQDFGRTEDVFYQINLKPGADFTTAEAGIKQAIRQYPQFKLISGEEYVEQNQGLFKAAFAGFYAMMVFLSIPSLIAMVNTLAISVIERTREIGMMRAVGATRRQIRTIILAEALILAAIGTAFGLLSGLYLGLMGVNGFAAFGFPLEYIFPIGGSIAAVAVGLLFGVLAAIVPARQAAKMNVVEALRYE